MVVSREKMLIDYLYNYWRKLKHHLDTAPEAIIYQQIWEEYLIATSPKREYYKSMSFRKNSIFPKRLAERANHTNIDLFSFFSTHEKQKEFFRSTKNNIEQFINKYLFPP